MENDPDVQAIQGLLGQDTQDAGQASADPDVQSIQSILSGGENQAAPSSVTSAVADSGDQSFNGYCQAFVEQQTLGHAGVYGSASKAYQDQAQKGNVMTDTTKLQPGAILYFSPNESNGGDGHTGIYMGNGQFISATDGGVKPEDINQWEQSTGQQLLGFSGGYK